MEKRKKEKRTRKPPILRPKSERDWLGKLLSEGMITDNHLKIIAGGLMVTMFATVPNYGLLFFGRRAKGRIRDI